ncbi:Tubulin polyglutamylase TTLL11 [Liparis tanakae]|uniref:Tubulin polyglutamylase TTLL11 n=1 Tax=Liparis tanakae TaxID=230148 RepID=A0A4Z2E4K5_9TELE|nr:Tubulin polyglutamylase TTLL11 [Liparis tanakae]
MCLLSCSSQVKAGEEIPMEAEPRERSPEDGALPSLCLKQVYPKYTKQFNHLRLVERIAALFLRFLGVKGNMRLGPTAFRTFIRYFRTFIRYCRPHGLQDLHQVL